MQRDAAARIIRFLRQMHAGDDEAALRRKAIEQCWLDETGAPTKDGERLVRAFDDLERVSPGV